MKFICLGYMEEQKWDAMTGPEREAAMAECLAYDDVLRKNGHFVRGEALQSVRNATTLRWRNGRVSATDGPFAETKEQLGGLLVLEARDLEHAIELMSKHPGVRLGGGFELRPLDEEITARANRQAIAQGRHALTPHLVCAGAAAAIEFYAKAFGAVEVMRLPGPGGRLVHAAVRIGDSMLMLVDEMPEMGLLGPKSLKGTPVTVHLFVEDVDATVAQAVAAGARVTMPVADMFWGDRYGQLEDPFGHGWSVATHLRDLSVEEIRQAARTSAPAGRV